MGAQPGHLAGKCLGAWVSWLARWHPADPGVLNVGFSLNALVARSGGRTYIIFEEGQSAAVVIRG